MHIYGLWVPPHAQILHISHDIVIYGDISKYACFRCMALSLHNHNSIKAKMIENENGIPRLDKTYFRKSLITITL